jgi:hypothetical protein
MLHISRFAVRAANFALMAMFFLGICFAQSQTHFSANNRSALALLNSEDELTSAYVQPFTNVVSGSGTQTFLLLDFQTENSAGFTEIFGESTIPNGDFQGDSTGHMSLNVDLSQVTGFTSCFTSFSDGSQNCIDNPTGTINIAWHKPNLPVADAESMFQKATFTFGRLSILMVGTTNNTNAISSGTAFGITFPASDGEMGISNQLDITVQKQ